MWRKTYDLFFHYDVFISYRRHGGYVLANTVYKHLSWRGYRVCMDRSSLKAGERFDQALLTGIERSTYFVLLLTPEWANRCALENDWVTREIRHALEKERTIVQFKSSDCGQPHPACLPADLRDLEKLQSVTYRQEDGDGSLKLLRKNLKSWRRTARLSLVASLTLVALYVVGCFFLSPRPESDMSEGENPAWREIIGSDTDTAVDLTPAQSVSLAFARSPRHQTLLMDCVANGGAPESLSNELRRYRQLLCVQVITGRGELKTLDGRRIGQTTGDESPQLGGFLGLVALSNRVENAQNMLTYSNQVQELLDRLYALDRIDALARNTGRQGAQLHRAALQRAQYELANAMDAFNQTTLGLPQRRPWGIDKSVMTVFNLPGPGMDELQREISNAYDIGAINPRELPSSNHLRQLCLRVEERIGFAAPEIDGYSEIALYKLQAVGDESDQKREIIQQSLTQFNELRARIGTYARQDISDETRKRDCLGQLDHSLSVLATIQRRLKLQAVGPAPTKMTLEEGVQIVSSHRLDGHAHGDDFFSRVAHSLEALLRDEEFLREKFHMHRASVGSAMDSLEIAGLGMLEPPYPGSIGYTRPGILGSLVSAMAELQESTNGLAESWLAHEAVRLQLSCELGTLIVNADGTWSCPYFYAPSDTSRDSTVGQSPPQKLPNYVVPSPPPPPDNAVPLPPPDD